MFQLSFCALQYNVRKGAAETDYSCQWIFRSAYRSFCQDSEYNQLFMGHFSGSCVMYV